MSKRNAALLLLLASGIAKATLMANDHAPTCGCTACTATHYTFASAFGVVLITDILPALVTA